MDSMWYGLIASTLTYYSKEDVEIIITLYF